MDLKSLLNKENPFIVEIGCNDGTDTANFYNLFSNPTVLCFEPGQKAIDLFKQSGYAGYQYWYAPVHLPDGVVITELRVWFYDNSASDLDVSLRRRAYGSTGPATEMAVIFTSGTPGSSNLTDSTISFATIDNNNYVYYIYIQFPNVDTTATLTFRQAKITYTTEGP